MTRALFSSLLGCFLLVLATGPARAADAKPQTYVVLVGVSQYADPQIKPRLHAEDDAKALYDLFTDKKYRGVDTDHVRLLLGKPDEGRKSEPATRENILKAVRWVVKEARRDDYVLFAFLGQGGPFADRSCYFASDSTFKDRAKNAVTASDFDHEFDKMKCHHFVGFLDVNFKGYNVGAEKVADPPRAKLYEEFLGSNDDEKEQAATAGRVLFLATDGFAPSHDLKEHGLFIQAILNGLHGDADKEGNEADGVVTVEELSNYLDKQVPELARANAKAKDEEQQQHHVLRVKTQDNNYVLTENPAVTSLVTSRLAKLADLARDGKITKEQADEGGKLLGRMPRLKAYRELRGHYQKLADNKLSAEDFTAKRTELLAGMQLKRATAETYAAKVIQATQVIKDAYVKSVNQGELIDAGVRGLFRRIDEKIPSDLRERLDNAKTMDEKELTKLLTDIRQRLGQREDLSNHKDLDFTLQRMMARLDPYTTYIDPEMLSRFKQDTDGRFTGIGIQINMPTRDTLQVITPLKGSPAYKAGLKAGDILTQIIREVDGEGRKLDPPDVINARGLRIDEAVKKIQGRPGTKVKIVVEREGAGSLEFEIAREVIEVETVLGINRAENDDWNYWIDQDNQIAYVRLTSFARNTKRDLERVVNRLEKKGVRGFILDLRFNPGGLLTSAVDISDLFIDDGLIVTIKPRVGREAVYTGESMGSHLNFPMVCLVNGMSASGSEIVAACLQDHKRAVVMGERSYGKGSVQNIQPFEGGELKLTTASYWRPNGKNINRPSTSGKDDEEWGVSPDKGFVTKLDPRERDQLQKHMHDSEIILRRDVPSKEPKEEFTDKQLNQALDYLRGQIKTAAKAPTKKAG